MEIKQFTGRVEEISRDNHRDILLVLGGKEGDSSLIISVKTIPDYIKEGLTTTIFYRDNNGFEEVVGYTIP